MRDDGAGFDRAAQEGVFGVAPDRDGGGDGDAGEEGVGAGVGAVVGAVEVGGVVEAGPW